MARPAGEKTRNGGLWTEARFNSFISSALRGATRRWPVKIMAKRRARVSRGWYVCEGCGEEVPATIKNDKGKRVDNSIVDHIHPIVDPAVGFTTWDEYIQRMFCEADQLQILCKKCHDKKSSEERSIAVIRRRAERESS